MGLPQALKRILGGSYMPKERQNCMMAVATWSFTAIGTLANGTLSNALPTPWELDLPFPFVFLQLPDARYFASWRKGHLSLR